MIDSVGSPDTDIVGEPKTDIVGDHRQDIGIVTDRHRWRSPTDSKEVTDRLGRSHRQTRKGSPIEKLLTDTDGAEKQSREFVGRMTQKDFIHDRQGGTVTIKHTVGRAEPTDREEPEIPMEPWNGAPRQV